MTVNNRFISCTFFDTDIDPLTARRPINYIDRLVELPPSSAVAYLRKYVQSQHQQPAAQLVIVDGSEQRNAGPFLPLLSFRGELHRGRRRWAVDLELNSWSN